MWKPVLPLLFLIFFLAACGGGAVDTGNAQMDYDATKKMVVDILKTDDGKKALQDIMQDEKVKQQLVLDQEMVTKTIEDTLVSEKGEKFWKEAFKDPAFASSIAKGMRKEQEDLLKALMKDPQYQDMMLSIMQDPEYQKSVTKLLKSKEYREHLQTVMDETFTSPLYKAKIQDILLKAATEEAAGGGKEKK
ncbi:spore germination lipoprotein GerD [Bacillus sp. FJAT-27231]|uniref:spore germination lipoprotein GerD n=1 Tax=Bacillus sp. FJAT-27231 TaxID=1679168 RepID=UPI00069DB212|nr:spore germination lipoprotein GerD [Bacillus sp. FJAT-27231]